MNSLRMRLICDKMIESDVCAQVRTFMEREKGKDAKTMSMQSEMIKKQLFEANLEKQLENTARRIYDKSLAQCGEEELYVVLLNMTKDLCSVTEPIQGQKKVYYISAEFLIGKLLSNNLINLGIYDKVEAILAKYNRSLAQVAEYEPEPSLGNGGLGRLAACFLDSIATLGLPGDGIGLNYHFGLFKQVFEDYKQCAVKNEWIEKDSWLNETDISFDVAFISYFFHNHM